MKLLKSNKLSRWLVKEILRAWSRVRTNTDSNDRKEDRSLDGFSLNSERSLFVMFHWCWRLLMWEFGAGDGTLIATSPRSKAKEERPIWSRDPQMSFLQPFRRLWVSPSQSLERSGALKGKKCLPRCSLFPCSYLKMWSLSEILRRLVL